jgi:hypothetical protein
MKTVKNHSIINDNKEMYERRLKIGMQNEAKYLPFIAKHYAKEFIKIGGGNSAMDFYSTDGDIVIELKTRTCIKSNYDTTLVGENKIKASIKKIKKNSNIKILFLFGFSDGLYSWQMNKENFEKIGGIKSIKTGSCSDEYIKKKHCHIPTKDLILVSKDIVPIVDEKYIELKNNFHISKNTPKTSKSRCLI